MPSSPELLARVRPWQPLQLAAIDTEPTTVPFRPDGPTRPPLQPFRVSTGAGVPDEVLEPARAAARAAGFAEGWTAGLREARQAAEERAKADLAATARAEADRDARRQRAFRTIDAAAAELERRTVPAAEDIQEQIIAAAFEIVEALVGRAMRDDAVRAPAALDRALSLAPAGCDVTVTVSPADFRTLMADGIGGAHALPAVDSTRESSPAGAPGLDDTALAAGTLGAAGGSAGAGGPASDDGVTTMRQRRGGRTVTIAMDPSLAPGDALAICGATRIDARLSAALDRVKEVLAQ